MNKSVDIYDSFETGSEDYHMCRICLDDDNLDNLIYPCKCKGSSKYVHKNCLNEWRTTSENQDNFKRCELCHHEYEITQNILVENTCKKDCRNIIKKPLPLFGLFVVVSFLLGLLTSALDTNKILEKDLGPTTCDDCLHPVYYVLGAGILLFIQVIMIISWFCQVKNKCLYCKIYLSRKSGFLSVVLCAIFIGILFGAMSSMVVLELGMLKLFQVHFYSIDKLNTENMLDIKNYEEDLTDEIELELGQRNILNEMEV
jgi:hypothetical protein